MFWSITPEGRLNGLPSEEFARNWAKTYPDDVVFVADLTPPEDPEKPEAAKAEIEGK